MNPIPLQADVAIHLTAAVIALALGITVLRLPKGTQLHRGLGRLWTVLMLVVIASSFTLRDLGGLPGGFSVIHLLSVFTLFTLGMAIFHIRRGRVRAHKRYMIGSFLGLAGAGLGALAPGRTLSTLLGYG